MRQWLLEQSERYRLVLHVCCIIPAAVQKTGFAPHVISKFTAQKDLSSDYRLSDRTRPLQANSPPSQLSTGQQVNKWVNVEQVDDTILVDIGLGLEISIGKQIDKRADIQKIDGTIKIDIA